MSTDFDPEPDVAGGGHEDPTEPQPTVSAPAPAPPDADPRGLDALDAFPDLAGDDEWPTAGPPSGLRVPVPVAALTLAAVALLGAAGGARLRGGQPATAPGANGNGAANAAAAGGPGGQGFGAGRGGGQGG